MNLLLIRYIYTSKSTIGNLIIADSIYSHTLEDVVRAPGALKVYGNTAIPSGRYKVQVSYSAKFGKLLPEILNIPNFSGVRIHGGNTPADTLGCILVGAEIVDNYTIRKSKSEALTQLLQTQGEHWIEIIDTYPYTGINV